MTIDSRCAAVTIATRDYLHFARALAGSISAAHPGMPTVIWLVDRPDAPLVLNSPEVIVRFADELSIPGWRRFAFQYTGYEISCALKPFILQHMLSEMGFDRVLFFDADIQVYGSLQVLLDRLDCSDLVLTPHLTAPLPKDGRKPDELTILRSGTFNAGFLGIKRSDTARQMLDWWRSKLERGCITDFASHLMVDQRWLDLAPTLFENVAVERDAGCNVAYWNLPHRELRQAESGARSVNGRPLVFFHFSGFDPRRPSKLSNHQDRIVLTKNPVLEGMVQKYVQQLDDYGRADCERGGYSFDRLQDGTQIQPTWREAIRRGHTALADVSDPFDTAATPNLLARFQRIEPDLKGSRLDWEIAGHRLESSSGFKHLFQLWRTFRKFRA